jgi:DNA-directed RNA polymerase subunit M/transcription elongation factor TFIIS
MATPSPLVSPSPYPVVCPKCRQLSGQPYDVFMPAYDASVTVYLECEACKHKWAVDSPAPILPARR